MSKESPGLTRWKSSIGRRASWNCSMKEIGFILMPLRLLGDEGDANKVPPATCLIGCANISRRSWPSWRIFGWILITIWRREIFGWSKCNKRSLGASQALLELKPLAAFAAICPRCANKACLCCRPCKPLFVVIPSFLHSSGPGQLQEDIEGAILQALNAYQYSDEINPLDVGLPSEVETINIAYVEDISDIHTVDARELASGGWFINATATARVDFDFFIYKGDSYILEEETSIGVNDYDWNDHYIWAQADKLVEVTLSLTFNEQAGAVTAIEINAFSPLQSYQAY